MKFPNKVISYNESIISKFPIILSKLEKKEYEPLEIYKKVKAKFETPFEYIEALDCLYALESIELTERNTLKYVNRN